MAVAARSVSEMHIRKPEVDLDPERTPEDLKDHFENFRILRTDEPDSEFGETEHLYGVGKDGTLERLDWDVLYTSLRQDTGYDEVPREFTDADLAQDGLGRLISETRFWRRQHERSSELNEESGFAIQRLEQDLEGQKDFNRRLQNEIVERDRKLDLQAEQLAKQQKQIEDLQLAVQELQRSPNRDPKRRKKAMLIGGLAVLGAGIAGYMLGRHTGSGPEIANNFKDLVTHNTSMVNEHNELLKEVNHLQGVVEHVQGVVDHDSKVIHDLRDRADDSSKLIHHLNDHMHHLEDAVDSSSGGSSGGGSASVGETTSTATTVTATSSKNATGRFYVEKGSSIYNEMRQYGHARGRNLSNNQLADYYNQLKAHFGSKIINLEGTHNNTYADNRLTQPGWAHWFPKAGHMLAKLVNK
jgi:hypothetical protein